MGQICEFLRLVSVHSGSASQIWHTCWVMVSVLLGEPKCAETDLKKFQIYPIWVNLTKFGANSNFPVKDLAFARSVTLRSARSSLSFLRLLHLNIHSGSWGLCSNYYSFTVLELFFLFFSSSSFFPVNLEGQCRGCRVKRQLRGILYALSQTLSQVVLSFSSFLFCYK